MVDNKDYSLEMENGILVITFKTDLVDLDISLRIFNDRLKISDGKKLPVLVKALFFKRLTKEARDFGATEEASEGVISLAIYTKSLLEKTASSLYLYLNIPHTPTRIFSNEIKAKEWLTQFVV